MSSSSASGTELQQQFFLSGGAGHPDYTPLRWRPYPEYSFPPRPGGQRRANLTLAPCCTRACFGGQPFSRPAPQLCSSYTVSEDGLTWTFTLRAG
ncbi:MAG: hypothetical protein V8S86_10560 [Eubacteriales bacterium]